MRQSAICDFGTPCNSALKLRSKEPLACQCALRQSHGISKVPDQRPIPLVCADSSLDT